MLVIWWVMVITKIGGRQECGYLNQDLMDKILWSFQSNEPNALAKNCSAHVYKNHHLFALTYIKIFLLI